MPPPVPGYTPLAPAPKPDDEGGDQELLKWELARMLELGVPYDDAIALAAAGVSWHEVERLVRGGCDPRRAIEIVG